MKVGARNQLKGRVTGIKRGDVMAQIKPAIPAASVMGSVITVDSLDELDFKVGDEVLLFVKAVPALPLKAAEHRHDQRCPGARLSAARPPDPKRSARSRRRF